MESDADESTTVRALAALAQPQRLRAFRALVVAGPQGLTPGAMAQQMAGTAKDLAQSPVEPGNALGQMAGAQ